MPSGENVQMTIEGDIKGQVAVGNFFLQTGGMDGGVVSVAPQRQGPDYTRRKGPVNLRPRPFLALLDRDEEIASARSAMQASRPVFFFGPAGVGKTSLLRSLAHLPETDQFPNGVVYLSGSFIGLEDILQSLFDAFHESQVNFKPTDTEIRTALQDIKALILLDDLELDHGESKTLLDTAPNCTFVLASLERILWEEGEHIALMGLPIEEALDLFVLELNRSLDAREQVEVRKICGLLAGHPLRVLQTASLVREKITSINGVKDQLQQDTPDELDLRNSLESPTDSQKSLIAILAAAGNVPVPVKHLEGLSESTELKSDLQKLVSLGLVQAHDAKFNLAGDLAGTVSKLWDLTAWEDRLIEGLVGWIKKDPPKDLFDSSLDLLVETIQKAEQKNLWHEVVRIGRGLENSLILSRRWQTWLDVLNLILKAARALGDRRTEAWALHQIGTRAACLGLKEPGRGFLLQALQIRRAIGDQAGESVTRNNLRMFFNIPLPPNIGQSGLRRCVTCGTVVFGGIGIISVLIAGLFLLLVNQSSPTVPPVSIPASATGTQTPAIVPDVTASPSRTAAATATYTSTEMSTFMATPVATVLVDFVIEADAAVWESRANLDPRDDQFGDCDLTFSVLSSGPCGFAGWQSATLEDDSTLENALVVQPYHSGDARVWGTYDLANLTIGEGDRLVTSVGLLKAAETSRVTFRVYFISGDPGFSPVLVYEAVDRNDGKLIEAVTLLPEDIIGQSGYFILQVSAAPSTDATWASWVVARLEHR